MDSPVDVVAVWEKAVVVRGGAWVCSDSEEGCDGEAVMLVLVYSDSEKNCDGEDLWWVQGDNEKACEVTACA